MRRLAIVVAALAMVALPSTAHAWTWPAPGDVLAPFVLGGDPYAGGQHRGIDVEGEKDGVVLAPASGVVAFAGSVGANGKVVTIETDGGYSVTLVHLSALSVGKGDALSEGAPVGTIGPSGTPEHEVPYVHLGIRVTSDPQGYVDPLRLLPPRVAPAPSPPPSPAPPPAVELVPPPPVHVAPPPVACAARATTGRGSGTAKRGSASGAGRACRGPRVRCRGTGWRGGSPRACARGGRSTAGTLVAHRRRRVLLEPRGFRASSRAHCPGAASSARARRDVRGGTEARKREVVRAESTADLGAPWRDCPRRRGCAGRDSHHDPRDDACA